MAVASEEGPLQKQMPQVSSSPADPELELDPFLLEIYDRHLVNFCCRHTTSLHFCYPCKSLTK